MTISQEQADWFKKTFDQLADNMEQAVLGKRHVVAARPDLPALRGPHAARGLPRHRQDDAGPGAGQHGPGQPRRASSSPPTCCRPTSPA